MMHREFTALSLVASLIGSAVPATLQAQASTGGVDPVQALVAVISIPLTRGDAYVVADLESVQRVAGLDSAEIALLTDRLGYRGTVGIPAEDEICRLTTKPCIAVVLDSYRREGSGLVIGTSAYLQKDPDACDVRYTERFQVRPRGNQVGLTVESSQRGCPKK